MQVILFKIPYIGLEIRGFGLMAMVAFIAGISLALWRSRENDLPSPFILDLGIVCLVSGIIGARIWFVLENMDMFNWSLLHVSDGGFNIAGGVLGLLIPFICYFSWRSKGDASSREETGSTGKGNSGENEVDQESTSAVPLYQLLIIGLILGVVLARVVFVYLHINEYTGINRPDPFAFLKIWQGGIVFFGGLFGGMIGGISFIYWNGYSITETADVFAAPLLLAQSIARWGCLLAGDDFGTRVSESFPLAVRFPREAMITRYQINAGIIEQGANYSTWVHPAQLYMSGGVFLCFLILIGIEYAGKSWSRSDGLIPGTSFGLMLFLYSIHRFIVEFFRGDPVAVYSFPPIPSLFQLLGLPGVYSGTEGPIQALRISQLTSVFLMAGSLIFLIVLWVYSSQSRSVE